MEVISDIGIAHRGRCMIADDMGLGKTFQALAIASYYRHNFPLLIVTTSTMRDTWQSKIHELLPCIPMMNIVTLSTSKDAQLVADRQTEVVIVSYKITTMHTDLLKNKKFGIVIIDESHYLKSHKAQCTIALKGIAKQSTRIILLSGTPALSRPAELFTQLELIEPRLFGSYTEYGKRYCAGKQTNFGWDMTGQSNLTELQIILQKRFLIRRTKEQVLTCLEGKTRESVLLDETLLEFSKEDRKELTQMAEAYKSKSSTERHAALLTFFSESARVKIPAVCKYVRQLLRSSNDKFLVFAHHRNVIDALCLTLDTAGVHYICIVGSTPPHARADLVDKFQFVETCRCAVLSITAANSGITLTAARLVLFAELHWNPGILTQAEARAHRIGQRGGVCARYLLARGTCDDHMWPLLQGKLNVCLALRGTCDDHMWPLLQGKLNGKLNVCLALRGTCDDHMWPLLQGKLNVCLALRGHLRRPHLAPATGKLNVLNNVGLSGDSFEGTATKHQESKTNITQYLSPKFPKNKNDYIPGTNIRKDKQDEVSLSPADDVDKSFLDDDEGDELLAALDL
ncbi:hypothetical protein MSG28_003308 [Choristoneura fumiferana]|uniref:Uncharacterized protein n=1 Tax=Choristoneura fumiferana TaxID=7141 RepID=A0ACC0KE58_CHOFU|nr:hypothetical protein MSG28_003308 [Choristoneura fumiferana]